MAQVIVRNLEDHVVNTLKIKAKIHGKSLEQELREILGEAAGLGSAEKLKLIDAIKRMGPSKQKTDSIELLREDRRR
ncbi:MAG: hypothetical protein QF511_10095 [Rhodospirillales bacterium]|nr:hypothetical protein [Rhodospirillales bacterium]HIJ43862.1 hypothetical protein [Rhodospirillaceae bacterium]MDP7216021.1 hypothetical protein [Rhodospirillales bacterium]HIJ46344.1 hypothetical protein [Rhodospirillaceae bacterium]HIJ94095.1 hypothetical protein [Rhodospirillaceae bacterium]